MSENILYLTHGLNGLLMGILPIGLGYFLTRKFRLGWRLFWIGGVVFILSQIGHIPFNIIVGLLFERKLLPAPPEEWALPFNAVFLGLSAGIFEEGARYLMYRFWTKESRWWGEGILLGAGHGGMEALLLGILVLYGYLNAIAIRTAEIPIPLSAEQAYQLQQYWSLPWYASLLGAVERLFTLPMQIALSLLVLQGFVRKQRRWLWIAILWHALIDGVAAVWIVSMYGIYAAEATIGAFALLNLGIIFALRQPRPTSPKEAEPEPMPLPPLVPTELPETAEELERTKYQ